jgi:hypothetical protein
MMAWKAGTDFPEGTPEDEKKFPKEMQKELDESKNSKIRLSLIWDYTLRFLSGDQWIEVAYKTRTIQEREDTGQQIRLTINQMKPRYRALLSRLDMAFPGVTTSPVSPSTEDICKSESVKMALTYWWRANCLPRVGNKLLQWLICTGNAFLHLVYDEDEDCIVPEVVSPYDVFYENGAQVLEESRWVACRKFHHRDDVIDAFPEHKKKLMEITSQEDKMRERRLSVSSRFPAGNMPKNRLEVFDIYWRDGRHATMVGDIFLQKDEYDLPHLPIHTFRYTEIPDDIWGSGPMEDLVDLQRLYNITRSQIVHDIVLNGNPRFFIDKNSGLSVDALESRPGGTHFINPTSRVPTQVASQPPGAHVMSHPMVLVAEMDDEIGLHPTSQGKRAVGVSSGRAINELSGQDQQQLKVTQTNVEAGMVQVFKNALEMQRQYWSEGKMVKIFDLQGKTAYKQIQAADIPDKVDVHIEAGSLFRANAEDRDAKVMQLLQLGLISPEEAQEELQFRTGNARIAEKIRQMTHAQVMLDGAKRGIEIEIYFVEDLAAYEKVFREFITSPDYYDLPAEIPSISRPGEMFRPREYIRDAYVDIITAGQAAEVNAQLKQPVTPRLPTPQQPVAPALPDGAGPMTPMERSLSQTALNEEAVLSPQTGLSGVHAGGILGIGK